MFVRKHFDWKQFDSRVPILIRGVTEANVKIVKVGSIRQLFIQSPESSIELWAYYYSMIESFSPRLW